MGRKKKKPVKPWCWYPFLFFFERVAYIEKYICELLCCPVSVNSLKTGQAVVYATSVVYVGPVPLFRETH